MCKEQDVDKLLANFNLVTNRDINISNGYVVHVTKFSYKII